MTDQEKLDQYFLARLMYWRSAIMDLENSAVDAVVATLEAVKREIGDLLFEDLAGLASVTDWNRERMAALEAFCDEVLAGAKAATTGTINESMLAAASASLQNYNAMLSLDGLALSVTSVAMSAEQIKSWFQTTPLGGRLLEDWVERAFSKGVKQSILQSLRKSQVKGQGTASMVRKLLQTALDDGFALTKREAITLARTYTQTANVEAQMAVYRKNEDLIYAWKWLAILDTSVCPRCGALDGKIYKKDEKRPQLPLHPRCRCLWQALMRIEELGVTSEDLEQVARPWVRRELKNIDEGGKRKIVEAGETKGNFGEWWKTLPENEQEYSVGKTRARLLREGKIRFGDLVDKSTGRLRPLEDLGFGRDGKTGDIKENIMGRNNLQREADNIRSLLGKKDNSENLSNWIKAITENIASGIYKPSGERKIIGALSDDVLSFMAAQGVELITAAMSMGDKDFAHALRDSKKQSLPFEIWNNIPKILDRPSAIFWDKGNPGLIYTFEENNIAGKIVIQPNREVTVSRKKRITNNIRTGCRINNFDEFNNTGRYKKIK